MLVDAWGTFPIYRRAGFRQYPSSGGTVLGGREAVPRSDNGDLTWGAATAAPQVHPGSIHINRFANFLPMLKGSFVKRGSPELEATLRRMVVVFRFLGWIWMTLLVIVTVVASAPPRLWIVYGSLGLATIWTLLTWYMARNRPKWLASGVWFGFDSVVMLAIGAASVAAGASELFHGGMPLSYVFVGALWGGLPGSLVAAVLLAVEQFAVHVIADLGAVRAAGSIIFFIIAAIVGWTFDRLRDYDLARQRAEGQLAAEREAVAAHEARVGLVNKLHDSVLQTFHAIRMGADDPGQARYLARRQERELRRNIEEWRSEYERSFRAALLAVRDDVEDVHRVEIEAVIRDDAALTPDLEAGIEAAREALVNAAKHSGAESISIFSEVVDGRAMIHVRDNGAGLGEPEHAGVTRKLNERVETVGGLVTIDSTGANGTEIKITVGR
jgi:signal transduction histidine kinase